MEKKSSDTRDRIRKVVRFLDRWTDRGLILVFLLLFFLGGYALYDSYRVYMDAADPTVSKFKPGAETEEEPDKEIQGFMAGWITMFDSNIDYPVMQGADNSEYLSKDPFGDYSLAGSIFLDARNAGDFTDDYSLIYGHHMEHGMMFGALDRWLEKSYADEHLFGELIVGETTHKITVFAVLESEATREELFSPTEVDRETILAYVKDHARILYEENVPGADDRILALSTCKFPDTAERTILICKF